MKPFPSEIKEERGLSNWVITHLREAILDGQFVPGEKLDQDLIATELNVSRTPIREALKVLATEGFVEIRSYRGVYIPIISQQDIHDVYEIRWVIESEITRQATPLIPNEVLDHLDSLLSLYGANLNTVGDRRHYEIDLELHVTIASYCQNKLFREILVNMNNRIVRVRTFAIRQSKAYLNDSQNEHMAVLKAIQTRNADEAARLMELHLRNSADRIENSRTRDQFIIDERG